MPRKQISTLIRNEDADEFISGEDPVLLEMIPSLVVSVKMMSPSSLLLISSAFHAAAFISLNLICRVKQIAGI